MLFSIDPPFAEGEGYDNLAERFIEEAPRRLEEITERVKQHRDSFVIIEIEEGKTISVGVTTHLLEEGWYVNSHSRINGRNKFYFDRIPNQDKNGVQG